MVVHEIGFFKLLTLKSVLKEGCMVSSRGVESLSARLVIKSVLKVCQQECSESLST